MAAGVVVAVAVVAGVVATGLVAAGVSSACAALVPLARLMQTAAVRKPMIDRIETPPRVRDGAILTPGGRDVPVDGVCGA